MSKRRNGSQLDLDLKTGTRAPAATAPSAPVLQFVDAATLKIRRDAVRRVAASGIFALPPNLRGD